MSDYSKLRELAKKATPGPWSCNSYSAIAAPHLFRADEEFWDSVPDEHTADRAHKFPCTPCGGGQCRYYTPSFESEPIVATVPAHHGDTAIGRQQADMYFIEAANPAVILELLDRLDALELLAEAAADSLPYLKGKGFPVSSLMWEQLVKLGYFTD